MPREFNDIEQGYDTQPVSGAPSLVSTNYALSAHTSVTVTYERWITHADADLNYYNSIVRATIARNF